MEWIRFVKNRYADGQICRRTDMQTDRYADGQICRRTDMQTDRYADGQVCRRTDMQMDRYADGQVCRRTDRQVKQKQFISGIYILNIKRNYTYLHLNILPIFIISQCKLLIPQCSSAIKLTFANTNFHLEPNFVIFDNMPHMTKFKKNVFSGGSNKKLVFSN